MKRLWGTILCLLAIGLGAGVVARLPRVLSERGSSDVGVSDLAAPEAARAAERRLLELGAKNQWDQAAALAKRLQSAGRDSANARTALGMAALEANRVREAESVLKGALEMESNAAPPRQGLISLHLLLGERSEARRRFAELAERGPLTFNQTLHWTLSLYEAADPKETIPRLEAALAIDPANSQVRLALGEFQRRANRIADAIAVLEPLSAQDPDIRAARALLALEQGDTAATERLATDPDHPNHPGLAKIRGRLALMRRASADAARWLRIALDQGPDDFEAQRLLGVALRDSGDPQGAQVWLDRAEAHQRVQSLLSRAVSPQHQQDNALVRELGAACAAAGRRAEAIAWLRIAIQRDPLDSAAQAALSRLERGLP